MKKRKSFKRKSKKNLRVKTKLSPRATYHPTPRKENLKIQETLLLQKKRKSKKKLQKEVM